MFRHMSYKNTPQVFEKLVLYKSVIRKWVIKLVFLLVEIYCFTRSSLGVLFIAPLWVRIVFFRVLFLITLVCLKWSGYSKVYNFGNYSIINKNKRKCWRDTMFSIVLLRKCVVVLFLLISFACSNVLSILRLHRVLCVLKTTFVNPSFAWRYSESEVT